MEGLAPDLRTQVLHFKVAQLQDVAGRLGLSRSGKKADLQTRILSFFGLDPIVGPGTIGPSQGRLEDAVRIVKDIYYVYRGWKRESSSPGVNASAATGRIASTGAALGSSRSNASGKLIRCLCQSSVVRPNMVQCTVPNCGVWQHVDCVGGAVKACGDKYMCEQCRASLADPFWRPLDLLLPVAKLKPATGAPPVRDSSEIHPVQTAERALYLNDQQLSLAKSNPNYERIQLSCLQLEDVVPCRYHWPRNIVMRVNAINYRPYARTTSSKMGINQRDDAANIAGLCLNGRNTIDIQAAEAGTWVLLLQRSRKRSVNEVKEMMAPKESLTEAVVRVKKLLHGGHGGVDSDDDVIAVSSQLVSLKDTMSGVRMTIPARFTDVSGLQAFDLDSFLSIAKQNRKWQDPITMKNSTVRQLQEDVYMGTVLACLAGHPDVNEVEISDEGKWRPEGSESRWFSIEEPIEKVKEELKSSAAGGGAAQNGGKSSAAGNGVKEEGVEISDSESDEEEELRKAAAAVRSSSQTALSGMKRKEPEPEVEVIDLISSSDDEGPVFARNTNANASRAAPNGASHGAAAAAQPAPRTTTTPSTTFRLSKNPLPSSNATTNANNRTNAAAAAPRPQGGYQAAMAPTNVAASVNRQSVPNAAAAIRPYNAGSFPTQVRPAGGFNAPIGGGQSAFGFMSRPPPNFNRSGVPGAALPSQPYYAARPTGAYPYNTQFRPVPGALPRPHPPPFMNGGSSGAPAGASAGSANITQPSQYTPVSSPSGRAGYQTLEQAEQRLSKAAREALEATRACLERNPSLVDEIVNVDDWLV